MVSDATAVAVLIMLTAARERCMDAWKPLLDAARKAKTMTAFIIASIVRDIEFVFVYV